MQTYKKAIVYPGPRLNLVLGPNGMVSVASVLAEPIQRIGRLQSMAGSHGRRTFTGSGKSSIVCAVGLALCATSKVRSCLTECTNVFPQRAVQGNICPRYQPGCHYWL